MPAPTNTSAATATDITALPYSLTQNVHDAGTTYTVWYKYTAQVGDNEIGMWGFGDLVTYRPVVAVFSPNGTTSYLSIGSTNKPIQVPVTAGVTYYFRFTPNAGNPTPANLIISALRFADQTVPAGSLAINDDTTGFPLVLISAIADQTVLAFVQNIAAGEGGDILPNGLVLLEEVGTPDTLKLYDGNYSLVATVTTVHVEMVTTNQLDTFYVGSFGTGLTTAKVTTVDTAGALGATTWDLGVVGIDGMCVSPDESILYFAHTEAVKRWNLVTNLAMSDLAASSVGVVISAEDLLCLDDGSVIVLYRNSGASTCYATRYSAAGATLNTYNFTFALSSNSDRLAHDTAETSFWVWLKGTGAAQVPTFVQVRVSDGTVLETITSTYYEGGQYNPAATATPTLRFGFSFSCPFWITRSSTTPPSGLNGPSALAAFEANGTLRDYRIVWSRRAPHLSDENQRVFYSKFQLDLEAGVGTVTGQGVTPTCELRWSNDGGFTWSGWRQLGMGTLGEYRFRAIAFQLGSARDRVFEVRGSDPVKVALLDAYLDFEEGTS